MDPDDGEPSTACPHSKAQFLKAAAHNSTVRRERTWCHHNPQDTMDPDLGVVSSICSRTRIFHVTHCIAAPPSIATQGFLSKRGKNRTPNCTHPSTGSCATTKSRAAWSRLWLRPNLPLGWVGLGTPREGDAPALHPFATARSSLGSSGREGRLTIVFLTVLLHVDLQFPLGSFAV